LDEAEAALKEALQIVAGGVGGNAYAAQAESSLAEVARARGDIQSALRHSALALQLAGYHTDKPAHLLRATLVIAARVSMAGHAFADAKQYAQDALTISESVARGVDTSADVGEALLRVAQAQKALGHGAANRPLVERAVRCLSNGLDPNHPLTAEARQLLATGST
jgi:hypothetical protein